MMNAQPSSLKEALDVAGKTQGDLARAAGVTPPAVSLWVSGDRTPGGPARRLIAQALDAPLDVVDSWFPASTQTEPALAAAEG